MDKLTLNIRNPKGSTNIELFGNNDSLFYYLDSSNFEFTKEYERLLGWDKELYPILYFKRIDNFVYIFKSIQDRINNVNALARLQLVEEIEEEDTTPKLEFIVNVDTAPYTLNFGYRNISSANYTLKWGDGTSNEIINTTTASHTYNTIGLYTVQFVENFYDESILDLNNTKVEALVCKNTWLLQVMSYENSILKNVFFKNLLYLDNISIRPKVEVFSFDNCPKLRTITLNSNNLLDTDSVYIQADENGKTNGNLQISRDAISNLAIQAKLSLVSKGWVINIS